MSVPLFASNHDRYVPLLQERLGEVIASGRYILGPQVQAFEGEFADYLGAHYSCATAADGIWQSAYDQKNKLINQPDCSFVRCKSARTVLSATLMALRVM